MIAAEVAMKTFYFPMGGDPVYVDTAPIIQWCNMHIGAKAFFRDHVSEEYPWTCSYSHGVTTWHFARAESATLFSLRWS